MWFTWSRFGEIMISWWCKGHQSHKLLTKNTSYQGVTFYWVPMHEFSEILQLCFKPLSHVHWKFTASCAHTVPTTDVQHKIIHKRSSKIKGKFLLIFAEIVKNQTLDLWIFFYCAKPMGYSYKHTIQCVFCMQSLRFWKIQFETTEPGFLRKLKFGKEVPILNSRYGNSSFRS
jgi:hypothetical protein